MTHSPRFYGGRWASIAVRCHDFGGRGRPPSIECASCLRQIRLCGKSFSELNYLKHYSADAKKITSSIRQTLQQTTEHLQRTGVDQPELAAGILMASVLNCPRLELYRRMNEKLTSAQIAAIEDGTRRLGKHEPIQYVLGHTDFMGRTFKCDPRALIPRPETEELVEFVVGHESLWQIDRPSIIDIGTGSGCIIVSLALHKKNGDFHAIDVSADAIALAKENARAHGVFHLIRFINADLTSGAISSGMDAVVANPPYVRTSDFARLEKNVRLWEPRRALDGGEDGLQVIRPLIKKAHEILKPDRFLFLEIGFDQWGKVQKLLAETGFKSSSVHSDISGHARIVMAIK